MITLVTDEVKQRQRTGFNYWNLPGCEDPIKYKIETLNECIERVFKVSDIDEKTRRKEVIFAKHFKRYILERMTKDNTISDKPRDLFNESEFKYTLVNLSKYFECTHPSMIHSSKTTANLIETDKTFRKKSEIVLSKIVCGKIIFPLIILRTCTKCGQIKVISKFKKDRSCLHGRAHQCRECYNQYNNKLKQQKRERQVSSRSIRTV